MVAMVALSAELRAWLAPGRAGTIAAVDRDNKPQLTRVWAARALGTSDTIEIYVHSTAGAAVLASLSNGGRAALNLIEVCNYRSRMFKGRCEISRTLPDPQFRDESLAALDRAFESVGLPPESARRTLAHGEEPLAMVALHLTVDSVFDQSPKPGAGARL